MKERQSPEENKNVKKFYWIPNVVRQHPMKSFTCGAGGVTLVGACGKAMIQLEKEDIEQIISKIFGFFENNIPNIATGVVIIVIAICVAYCYSKKLKSGENTDVTFFDGVNKIIEQNDNIQINYKNGDKEINITSSQKMNETLKDPPNNVSSFIVYKGKSVNNEEVNFK